MNLMEVGPSNLELSKEKPIPSRRSFLNWQRWVPWMILVVAAFFRIAWLDIKPAHFDEGINGWFVDQMTKLGCYKYDPTNYHGPLHFYLEFVSLTIFGRNLWALRMPVVLAGLATVWMAWAYRRHIGDRAAAIAAAGLAVSPGFVFYQRYAIHEAWLVLSLMLLVWGILEMGRYGTRHGMFAFVIGFTGAILTKETYLIHFVAAALAGLATCAWQTLVPTHPPLAKAQPRWTNRDVWQAVILAMFALVFFYSGNFFHWPGLKGMFTTFSAWIHTGVDTVGHMKKSEQLGPINYYWLKLAWIFEPLMLAGILMSFRALGPISWATRWLAFYAIASLCAYSLIPYKTPWCVISIAWPFYLLAGILLKRLLSSCPSFALPFGALAILAFSYTIAKTIDLNFQKYDDDTQEYVYVQTYRDVRKVLTPIASLLKRAPEQMNMRGRVHLDSYYPLPWYFGGMSHVTCPKPGKYLDDEDAGFLIGDGSLREEIASHLTEAYYVTPFRLRSGKDSCVAFFNEKLFAAEFNYRKPDIVAKAQPFE